MPGPKSKRRPKKVSPKSATRAAGWSAVVALDGAEKCFHVEHYAKWRSVPRGTFCTSDYVLASMYVQCDTFLERSGATFREQGV